MYSVRRITPICPECNQQNTYDVLPEIPNIPEYQLNDDELIRLREFEKYTVGNANYFCIDCNHMWTKYSGMKLYERINVIQLEIGGYPGPFFDVEIDFENLTLKNIKRFMGESEETKSSIMSLTEEKLDWFRSELFKCDLVNWAEEYYQQFVMDGTQWSVKIQYDTFCEIKIGSNHFPKEWEKFSKAVTALSGIDIY